MEGEVKHTIDRIIDKLEKQFGEVFNAVEESGSDEQSNKLCKIWYQLLLLLGQVKEARKEER